MQKIYLLLVVVVVYCVSESFALPKDRDYKIKKKNRDLIKTRSELSPNLNETVVAPVEAETEVQKADGDKGKDKEKEEEKVETPVVVQDEIVIVEAAQPEKDKVPAAVTTPTVDSDKFDGGDAVTTVAKPKPPVLTFGTRVKNVIRKVMQILGMTQQKRKSRMLDVGDSDNILGMENLHYTDEMRATVGALFGRRDCLRRAACGAGAYLRNVKGKEVLIVLLEKFSPSSWADSVNVVKEAAIYKDPCNYECE